MTEKPQGKRAKLVLSAASLVLVALCISLTFVALTEVGMHLKEYGDMSVSFTTYSIHTTITVMRGQHLVLDEYHAGAVTKLGMNMTLAKLTGNATLFNVTTWDLNCTYISIGNKGTLDTDDTVLPGEWNRTAATQHDGTYNACNWTAIFTGTTGSQTADCIGLNWEAGVGIDYSLWGYDTFTEVSGIDSTFTVTVEVKVSLS